MESPIRSDLIPDTLEVIETFGFFPGVGFPRLALHLQRFKITAQAVRFPLDSDALLKQLARLPKDQPLRCRLGLRRNGLSLTTEPLAATGTWRVEIAQQILQSNDPWRRYKTSERMVYTEARAQMPENVEEVVLLNERGEVAEGTITNVFVRRPQGDLVTPPCVSGALPGVFRQELLERGEVREAVISLADLRVATEVFVANSLRGKIDTVFTPPRDPLAG